MTIEPADFGGSNMMKGSWIHSQLTQVPRGVTSRLPTLNAVERQATLTSRSTGHVSNLSEHPEDPLWPHILASRLIHGGTGSL